MKGLLLKDFYMMKKYCRSYILIALVFCAVSLVNGENIFFVFYPCLLCGMLPVTLLAYDERSRWLQYSGTLPYTRGQIVSGKYLMGVFTQIAVLLVTGICQALRMIREGGFDMGEFIMLMLLVFVMATVTSSVSLPFMFRWGVEKGRMAYYVMIGMVCAGGFVGSAVFEDTRYGAGVPGLIPLLAVAGVGIYAISWYLSVHFFRAREGL